MEFRILGPLEVWDGGCEVSLGGRKPRALLALLLLHPNEVVSADRLIDELWGEDSPERAAGALRVNVSRLRKALPPDVLTTRSPGYVIRVEPDDLDLHRFERLVDEARGLRARGLAADASERLREALSLWRGPALADFAYESFAQAAIARLEEIRLAAVELRIDADLALGRHDELVGELEALVAEQPLRERLRGYLMTALYRSGRQAEALDAYKDARRALVDELGIEPSTALQELERAILRQEPALNLPATAPASVGEAAERSILVAITHEARVDALLAVAEPLVRHPPRVMILARLVLGRSRASVGVSLARRAPVCTRSARCRSPCGLVHVDGAGRGAGSARHRARRRPPARRRPRRAPGRGSSRRAARRRACGDALRRGAARCSGRDARGPRPRPVRRGRARLGGGRARRVVRARRAMCRSGSRVPPRCRSTAGATRAACSRTARSRSNGSLGISAEPLLTPPGEEGMLEASRDAGLLVVGLSTRWHREGLGPARLRLAREATPPTLLVRRGLRPGGLAPPPALTRFTWSIRP